MKYKVIIAEDEPIERSALQMILCSQMPRLQVIAEACNGFELIDLMKKETPDLVLLDINMPGINGLDAIEQISSVYPKVSYIIISAHSDFAFAQRAIRLGAADYLNKPLKTDLLLQTLNHQIQKLDQEYLVSNDVARMTEQIHLISQQMEKNIMRDFFSGRISDSTRRQIDMLVSRSSQYLCVLVKAPEISYKSFHSEEVLKNVREQLLLVSEVAVIQDAGAFHFFIISADAQMSGQNIAVYIDNLRSFIQIIYDKANVSPVDILIGEPSYSLDDLLKSYKVLCQKSIQNFSCSPSPPHKVSSIYQLEQGIIDSILRGNNNHSLQLSEELILRIKEKSVNSIDIFKESLRDSFSVIHHGLHPRLADISHMSIVYNDIRSVLQNADNYSVLESCFTNYIITACESINTLNVMPLSDAALEELTVFIRDNYTSDISLDQIASKYGVSVSYLSKFIKNRFGKNFIDYLTDMRIQKAKELLLERKKTIKEISQEVGYNSQTYFCKVFKKHTGVNASEYIEMNSIPNIESD